MLRRGLQGLRGREEVGGACAVALAGLVLALSLACGRGTSGTYTVSVPEDQQYDPSKDTRHETHALKSIPEAAPGTLLMVFHRDDGTFDRIDEQGRWTHGGTDGHETPKQVHPKGSGTKRNRMTEEGLDQLKAAIAGLDLASLPGDVPTGPGGGDPAPLGVTFSTGDRVVTVKIAADPKVPSTFGPLEPVATVLNEQVYGN